MKIAIIYPSLNGAPHQLELGIAYLATYISQRTPHQVKVIDLTFHRRHWKQYLRRNIEEFKPDVIGFSVFSAFWEFTQEIAREIRSYHQARHIAGGYQAILSPEETIDSPLIDAICTGEGEHTLAEYLDALEAGRSPEGIQGIWYKETGGVVKNPPRLPIEDLDTLPFPDWDLFEDIDRYLFFLGRLYVIGTRGCPYRCSFCGEVPLEKVFSGKRYREASPERYVEEIEYQYRKYRHRGMLAAHLFDTVFSFHDEWLDRWIAAYKAKGLDRILPFTVFVRPDRIKNATPEKLRKLAGAGCAQVRMGIEAGSDSLRSKEIRKPGCTNSEIQEIFVELNRLNILVECYFIIGFPHDTKQTILDTIRFADNPLIQIQFVLSFTPIQGTPMAERTHAGTNSSRPQNSFSFYFSGGARNANYPRWFVKTMLLWSYLYFGLRLAWNSLTTSPLTFMKVVPSRIFKGMIWGNSLTLTTLYGIIHASFWSGLRRRQRSRMDKNSTPVGRLEDEALNG